MSCLKYSLILVLIISNAFAGKFTSKQCLDAKFNTSVKNDGKFFGLIKNDLSIDKSQCIIKVNYKNVLEKEWLIDICREPIHMKISYMKNQTVNKRVKECVAGNDTDFCTHWKELKETLQDYGLIFAEGEREDLSSSHGQTYCTYLLAKKYLAEGYLFSKFDLPTDIFVDGISKPITNTIIPVISSPSKIEEATPAIVAPSPSSIEDKAQELIEDSAKF